jgi:2-oxoglutarate ferredoxin oxidoreductase subunit beta
VIQAKKAIQIAFEAQMSGLGFTIVELLSSCPTNWGMTPVEAVAWVKSDMIPTYPLGDYKVANEIEAKTKRGKKR